MNESAPARPAQSWMRRPEILWAVFVAALFPVVVLTDDPVRAVVRDLQAPFVFRLMQGVSLIGKSVVLMTTALIVLMVGLWRRDRALSAAGQWGLIALMCVYGATFLFKHGFGRPRPHLMDAGVWNWGLSFKSGHDSFPSGHASLSFALATVLSSVYPAWRGLWYTVAALVAFSRVYIDVHFSSDVFAGAVLGLLIGWLILRFRSSTDRAAKA